MTSRVADDDNVAGAVVDDRFFRAVGKLPLLTPAGELRLAKAIEGGDETARNKMIESNMRLVIFVARRYLGRGVPLLDLIQEGTFGLSRAVEKFEWRRGRRFSTYAVPWIQQACQRAVDDQGRTIRLPTHVMSRRRQVERVAADLEASLQRTRTVQEIAELTPFTESEINQAMQPPQVDYSLDSPFNESTEDTPLQLVPDDVDVFDVVVDKGASASLMECVKRLDESDRAIVEALYGVGDAEPRSGADFGRESGTDSRQIYRLQRRALNRLRHMAEADPWLNRKTGT